MIAIIIGLVLLGFIVFAIYPAISTPHTSDYMIEEDSPSYMENEEKPVTELVIEKTPTDDDFVEKELEFKDTVGGRQLTEHIAEVVQLNPNSKKRLNKRERKTVDKIVKGKKKDSWNPGYYDLKGDFIEYEKHWFCNTNKTIHQNEKEFLNCIYCNKEYLNSFTLL